MNDVKVRRRLLAFTPVIGQKQLWSCVENLLRKRVPARRLFKGKKNSMLEFNVFPKTDEEPLKWSQGFSMLTCARILTELLKSRGLTRIHKSSLSAICNTRLQWEPSKDSLILVAQGT